MQKPKSKKAPAKSPKNSTVDPAAIRQVYRLLIEGHGKIDIIEAIEEQFPDHEPNQLLAEAAKSFAVIAAEPLTTIKGWALESTRTLYRKLVEVGDYVGALRAIKQLTELAQLETKKQTPKGAATPPAGPDDDIDRLLQMTK